MNRVQIATGLRERKKERTRQAVIDVAWRLFRQKGYDATTVDEIAEQSFISRRTFFRYFPNKESVVFHESPVRLAYFRSQLVAGGTGFRAVSHACLELARHYEANKQALIEEYRLIRSAPTLILREGEIDGEWMEAIAETLGAGGTRAAGRRNRVLAGAIFGAVRATLAEWLAADGSISLVGLGEEAMSIFEQ
jgi:AcrR family transcriptional regulator